MTYNRNNQQPNLVPSNHPPIPLSQEKSNKDRLFRGDFSPFRASGSPVDVFICDTNDAGRSELSWGEWIDLSVWEQQHYMNLEMPCGEFPAMETYSRRKYHG